MSSKNIYVLSDIHLGTGQEWDWYQKKQHEKELIDTLEYITQKPNPENIELVLAGDVFDTWLCPMDERPPSIAQILEHNKDVVDELKRCVSSLGGVFYINGNHDMHVTQNDLNCINCGDKSIQCISEYRAGLLKVEHGHKYAMFNAKDKLNDGMHGLPIGYFITRMLAGNEDYDKPGAIARYIDDLLEAAITTQTISSSVIEALMEHTGKRPDDEFIMPFGRRNMSINEIKDKYANLFTRWVEKYGYWYAINSIRAELGNLGWFADRLARRHDYRVVVMGHTHDSGIDEDRVLVNEDRIYANSGFWATDKPSYVHIEKAQRQYTVSLYEKHRSTFKLQKKASV